MNIWKQIGRKVTLIFLAFGLMLYGFDLIKSAETDFVFIQGVVVFLLGLLTLVIREVTKKWDSTVVYRPMPTEPPTSDINHEKDSGTGVITLTDEKPPP